MGCGSTKPSPVSNKDSQEPAEDSNTPVDFKAVHSAIRWDKRDALRPLLTGATAANVQDSNNGNYPIHIAAQNGHLEVLKMLIAKKAIVNAKNGKGNTAIHMAVGYDYYECAKYLISVGGDITIENDAGHQAQRGIDGDKTLGLCAFVSAKTAKEAEDALKLCEESTEGIDKASFASSGLRLKKELGGEWSDSQCLLLSNRAAASLLSCFKSARGWGTIRHLVRWRVLMVY